MIHKNETMLVAELQKHLDMYGSTDYRTLITCRETITVAILEEDLTLKSSFQTIFAHFEGVKINEFR